VVALSIINERKELVKSLTYDDVAINPVGPIPSVVEDVVRNNQTYTLTFNIEIINDPLTVAIEDYKKVEIIVEWLTPSGGSRDSSVVTYITDREKPKVCTSCESGDCDLMTGICVIPDAPSDIIVADTFTELADTELSLHNPEIGSGWTRIIGTGTLQVKAVVGELRKLECAENEGVLYQSNDEMSAADYSVSVGQVLGNSDAGYNILAVRIQDANNMYALKWNSKNVVSDPGIYKRQDGVWTRLIGIDGIGVTDGSVVMLKVEGYTISMLDDSAEVVSVYDSTFISPGRIGVGMGSVITAGDYCSSQMLDDLNVSRISGESCVPGLLCSNGSICPLTKECTSNTTIPAIQGNERSCRLGEVCSSGALCSLSGVCPTQSCLDDTCPAGNACFTGFCYSWGWYDLTFDDDDQANPADVDAWECKNDVCDDVADCPSNCQSDCQFIDSAGFSGCGRWEVISECRRTWIPECRNVAEGGAVGSCRGGYNTVGVCEDIESLPVPCPAGAPRSWCANGEECGLTSSDALCVSDSQCPVGEMCDTGSGKCRTICPNGSGDSSYWGGWAKGCSSKAIVAGASDCSNVGGICQGPVGDCAVEGALASVTASIVNVDPSNHSISLSNPIEVTEGAVSETTDVAFRITLTGTVLDTIMLRVDPNDGSAVQTDDDYRALTEVLTFEPGGSLDQVVTYSVLGDNESEVDEDFSVRLEAIRSVSQPVVLLGSEAGVVILNDDTPSSPSSSPSPSP
jgi:hypothetical protein